MTEHKSVSLNWCLFSYARVGDITETRICCLPVFRTVGVKWQIPAFSAIAGIFTRRGRKTQTQGE